MDRRSWPWKKKTSDKIATVSAAAALSNTGGNQGDQDNGKTVDYVQISAESYAHLTKLEDQVKILNEKLSSAQSEMTTKDNLVKQHAKVAEEAVAGWEKAEAETSALKHQLESSTLLKLTAEDRVSHLDGALKECMKQIRNVKEESEQKLHDTIFTKTKQWEKVKVQLEAKIADFEQELLRSSAENAALSRSLQERSSVLMKISEEKSQAEADIEVLKSDIQSREREINSLRYELHVVSKELEIRNEEKNMSMRSAEAANKQHIEDVKKLTKLEAECQRLRVLVRKKLPGPAALAQMKLEVENLGRAYGETRVWRSPSKSSSPYLASPPNFSLENIQQCHKENEFLTERILAMEEETKMLKEALSKRNRELQTSRNICVKTANKLRSIETHVLVMNQHKSPLKSNIDNSFEGSLSQNESNQSLTSMSEDGIDEEGSCSESWSTALISELSQLKKEKDVDRSNKADNSKQMELMDDFLEMERLARLSTETIGTIAVSNEALDKMKIEISADTSLDDVQMNGGKEQQYLEQPTNLVPSNEQTAGNFAINTNNVLLSKLQSRITSLFESQVLGTDVVKLLEDIRRIVQDTEDELPQHPSGITNEETHSIIATCEQEHCLEDMGEAADSGISLKKNNNLCTKAKHAIDKELKNAISQIHNVVVLLCKEAVEIQGRYSDDHVLREKVEDFSASINKLICDEINLDDFIFALCHMLSETRNVRFNMLSDKGSEGQRNSNDCIDKLTLLENRVSQHEPTKGKLSGECSAISHGPTSPGFELKAISQNCSLEEFEKMKLERDHMEMDLARSTETLERTKLQLAETEQHLAELKSQLSACQKSNSLADTQLKCMAESYKSLESRTQELETEINLLCSKAEALDNELQEERRSHQDDLAKYQDLQEQIERDMRCSMCSLHSDAGVDIKTKQEREIAAAAEKLAECQETIILLGRQLKALHPPTELIGSSPTAKLRTSDGLSENQPSASVYSPQSMLNTQQSDQTSIESDGAASVIQRTGEGVSSLDGYNPLFSPSNLESSIPITRPDSSSKRQKHRSRSASSSSLSSMLNDKHGRGFRRFFSKGKSDRH